MKKILVWGNTRYTAQIIKTLSLKSIYDIKVITNNSKSNPVIIMCQQMRIEYIIPSEENWKESAYKILTNIKPDLCIVIAYGKIIPQKLLDFPQYGFVNIHGSLLPILRGATPIQKALLDDMKGTGVTIQRMVYKMDAGDILEKYLVNIDIEDNFETLLEKMILITSNNIDEFLERYFSNLIIQTPQKESNATYCTIKEFSRENGKIDWNNNSIAIHNRIRAFYPEPIAWCNFPIKEQSKKLNILQSEVTEQKATYSYGVMFYINKTLYVSTVDKDIKITLLVLEGKRKMTGIEFGNGWVKNKLINII